MTENNKSLKQIIDFRKDKLKKLEEMGIDPYPQKYSPSHLSSIIISDYESLEGKDVNVAGRIMSIRRMGKSSFFHIQDGGGRLQIFIKRDDIGEDIYNHFKLLDIGDFVGVEGFIFKTKVNEISIHAKNLTVLCKSIRPLPIVKEKEDTTFDAFSDKEQRYRNRHLDLIVNTDIRDTFIKRANIIKSIRNYLDDLGFLEVETPVLQPLYGGANARPFTTHHNSLDQKLFLRIADELYLKRLIIGGIDRVYELSKDFRNEGMDRNHNPEFTMLEFYWAYADYEDNMDLVEAMIRDVAKNIGAQKINWGEMTIDLAKPFKRKPIFELLKEATGEDFSNISLEQLRKICIEHNIEIDNNANYGQMLDGLMSKLVEPNLIEPTFVIDYPKEISPLAKKHRNGDPNLVERFELFIGTAEFANAFTELNDPIDQRDRFESQEKLERAGDDEAHPIDENFLQAIECGMPPTAGVGIGIDRLVMLLTENLSIKDVILFPAMRKEE
ncbi:MAG: lysine--tRNA ligase [Candidatus Marinimicrobia bacterium]|nr:lysine--tRNA ligase [Candidatus Neomarinimicrobiota bacterium]|tara:strand:- start:371 stop:1861 length:1491 start_codon:yes stop_codon:yes gene_type:complete